MLYSLVLVLWAHLDPKEGTEGTMSSFRIIPQVHVGIPKRFGILLSRDIRHNASICN